MKKTRFGMIQMMRSHATSAEAKLPFHPVSRLLIGAKHTPFRDGKASPEALQSGLWSAITPRTPNMSEQTIAELIAERDDSLSIQRIQSATLERMIAARDAEQLAKERAEKNVCTLQDALFEILMHTESYNYNSYQRIISKIAKMAVKALKESGAKLEKTR